ncbi:MAG: hypothetical protein UHM08_08770 [Bacteroidales bacterium]|nr:hypothetical protein [Bacteroidales bacterium]
MQYEVYGYHCADTSPVNYDDLDIFGIELEIDDDSNTVRDILNECIEDDILTSPYNEHRTRNWKVIENDSSVFKEIILNADTVPNLLNRVKTLNNYGLCSENVYNSRGTSCHIHINRRYLEKRGITALNMLKMFEFYAPFIYAISGRDLNRWNRWAEPITSTPLSLINWKQRGEEVRHIGFKTNRYHMVNTTRTNTIELRGFSNYYNFDYDMLKFYLSFVNFCIDEAEKMKGKYYREEWEMLVNDLKKFIDKHPAQKAHFLTDRLFIFSEDAKRFKDLYVSKYKYLINGLRRSPTDFNMFCDWLYYHQEYLPTINYRLTLTPQGVKNAQNKIINKIYKELQSYLWHAYQSIKDELKEVF